jgi:hypothetical protein
MNSAESFSADYLAARARFIEAARGAGAALETISHPERGPAGGELATDVAWLGPRDAEAVLVMISATHGVEGFCGSGAQVDWLRREEWRALLGGTAVLIIHAINPYGFAWLRRVTHENVDLNRNWVDFNAPRKANPAYDALADVICPAEWTAEVQASTGEALKAYADEHGAMAMQQAVSGGQYNHPRGVFYGGDEPTWSRRTQTGIFEHYLRGAGRIAIIDYHTGLGPWGFGEHIVVDRPGSAGFRRAAGWYGGGAVTSPAPGGDSTSAEIVGDGLSFAPSLLGHAEVTGIALEFGTKPIMAVMNAIRADAWLHAHGDPLSPEGRVIKAEVRDAFYGDADDWKGMVAGQSLLAARQALKGLKA